MVLTWLIEADAFGTSLEPLKAEIRRQGMTYHVVRFQSLVNNPHDTLLREITEQRVPVLVQSSYALLAYLREQRSEWKPLGWCTAERLRWSVYAAHLGEYLLNSRYALLPSYEALRLGNWLFELFGRDGQVFLRPDTGDKRFTGRLVDREAFGDALAPARYDPEPLVVVAAPRRIGAEWRLVVSGEEVLAASRYRTVEAIDVVTGCPPEVADFIGEVLATVRWRPDPIFVADVCESDGRYYLLELNGFSCAGLYACDPAPIVRRAAELILNDRMA